ncbi:MAG: hypothetical protein KDK97_24530 [Verrucomicrobiales bacterium]|nr:hypothetical protein [Verrucomicrobiales bacterium]MCP5559081.1 hypothetical protein [Verrucomicrobiaceae bacterium]
MRHCILLLTLLIFSQGCKDHEGSSFSQDGSSNGQMKVGDLIGKEGELTFADSAQSSGTCTFQFRNDGKVTLDSFAYNICKFSGTFREENGVILISFHKGSSDGGLPFLDARTDPEVIHLPPLTLKKTSEGIVLIRKDGRTDFSEHWNIYPDAIENLFPFRMVTLDRAEPPSQR